MSALQDTDEVVEEFLYAWLGRIQGEPWEKLIAHGQMYGYLGGYFYYLHHVLTVSMWY